MRLKYNMIFVPLLIVAAIVVWFLSKREQAAQAAKRISDRALVELEEVEVVQLSTQSCEIRMQRSEKGSQTASEWIMTAPFEVGCDPGVAGKMLEAIFSAESERDIAGVTSEQAAEYGLDSPEIELRLFSGSGEVLMRLQVGAKNPQGTHHYAFLNDDRDTCLLIPVYTVEDMNVTVEKLRDPRAARFDTDELVSIQLSSAAAEIHLEQSEGVWTVTRPNRFTASPARVDVLLHDLGELRAVEYLAADARDPELATETVRVSWTESDGESGWLSLRGEDYSRGIFAMSSSQPTPFIVEAYIHNRLALDPGVFFEQFVFNVSAQRITKVVVRQRNAENLEIQRTGEGGEGWQVVKPSDAEIPPAGAFSTLVESLLALEPSGIGEPLNDGEEYGLRPVYFMKVEVYTGGAEPESVLYIGNTDENGNYFATQDWETLFTIEERLFSRFLAAVDVLRRKNTG